MFANYEKLPLREARRVRAKRRQPVAQGIESLEDRRLLSVAPGTVLGTTPVGPVLAEQGTPVGPVAVGNFRVAGSYTSGDFASTVNFGDGSPAANGTIVATPGAGYLVPANAGQDFTVTGGTGPDIVLNANLSATAGQIVGPNNNPFTNNPSDQPVTYTSGTAYVPSGLNPAFDANQLVGRLVSGNPNSNPIATLKPQGDQTVAAQSGDGAPTSAQRRGEVLMTFSGGYIVPNGLTGAFNSNPANAEIFIAESGNAEYLSVSLVGLDANGVQHQTGYYFQVPISTDKTAPGAGAAAYTAIDLDFVAPGSIGKAAQDLGIVKVTGVAIQSIRAGFYDPAHYNTAYDVINANVSGTNQFGPVLRRGIDFYANSLDTGNPAILPPAGTVGLPHYGNSTYANLDDPDIVYVVAGPNSLFMPTTNVVVNASHRFLEDGNFVGATTLNLANNPNAIGEQAFDSHVDPLVLTYTVQPTIGVGVVVSGQLAITDAPPQGYPNPLPQYYTATVDWGDGTTSPALVQDANNDGILEIVNDPNNPHAYNNPGTYLITISLFTDNVLVSATSGQIVVNGEPEPPRELPFITINDITVNENAGVAQFTVLLSKIVDYDVRVDFATDTPASGPVATAGVDYTPVSGTHGVANLPPLIIPAGSQFGIISVPIINDGIDEYDERFLVRISNALNGIITKSVGVGTIVDDDPEPTVTITSAEAYEGGPVIFQVNLSGPSGKPIQISYHSQSGSATGGIDYANVAGTLTFQPGETSKSIEVATYIDNLEEGTENFSLVLTDPVNVVIPPGGGSGTGTILEAGRAVITVLPDPTPAAEGTDIIFTVTLDRGLLPANAIITVDYTTVDLTAIAGQDYLPRTGTLTFGPGETTKQIAVPTIDDSLYEGTERFALKLSNPSTGATISNGEAVGTILDNEIAPVVRVQPLPPNVAPGVEGGVASFLITLSGPFTAPVTVTYQTADLLGDPNHATAGLDYLPTAGSVVFAPGETAKIVTVQLLNDGIDEPTEYFGFYLSSATVNGVPGIATIDPDATLAVGAIVDVTPPKVVDVQRLGYHNQPTTIVVRFSEAMNADTVQNVYNYRLVSTGADGRFNTADDVATAIKQAVYDPATNSVTLYLAKSIPLHQSYQLTVNGTAPEGVRDLAGNLLNGGNNAVIVFGRTSGLRDLRNGTGLGHRPTAPRPYGAPPKGVLTARRPAGLVSAPKAIHKLAPQAKRFLV